MAELANGGVQEEVSDAPEGEEQEAILIKKRVKLESNFDDEEDAANKENAEDKTEDQVPDITNEDPMTTSMDGIEEISANEGDAANEGAAEMNGEMNGVMAENDEQLEETKPTEGADEENTEKDVAEIPVNVYEEGGEPEQPQAENEGAEGEGDGEGELPVEEENQPVQEEEEVAAQMQDVPVEVEAEEPVAETEAEAEQPPAEEPAAEEANVEEGGGGADEPFELRAPPVPKRPRTPNELDEPQMEEQEQTMEEGAPEEQPAVMEEEQPPPAAEEQPEEQQAMTEVPVEVEQLPGTPKSFGSRRGSGGSKVAADPPSVASPVPATPKSGGTTTPKSTLGGNAFDFEKPKRSSNKRTTFEDEVLSVKSSKSKSPRSPRSPRTPRTPTKSETEEPKADEGAAADEEEKQRQASYEARMKEREEEEARWKRMTSWDKGEDGTVKEEQQGQVEQEQEEQPAAAEEVEAGAPIGEETEEKITAEEGEGEGEEAVKPEGEVVVVAPAEEGAEVEEAPKEEGGEEAVGRTDEEEAAEQQGKLEAPVELEGTPPPPPPRAERSPSPVQRREPSSRDYSSSVPYDQDLKGETVPTRMPADDSFSSWTAVDRDTYKPVSPWVDRSSKYRNEYTVGEPPVAPSAYTAFFDDLVATGPFASSLYSTSRLLERSRSRTRERRQALRSQSQARNYFRFASQHPAPLRSRDYSTPPSSMVSRAPTAGSSFVSFMDYSGAKQYEMARSQSLQRSPLYQSNLALSRSASRGGIDYYLGLGRPSRVDSYVDSIHRPYEWNMPSNYEMYRASSRGQVGYAPLTNYQSYVGTLQRSLSRERYERDRLRNKYTTVSYQLEQACKQMDLLRSNNYSAIRSGSAPRTSVYAHFYPYY